MFPNPDISFPAGKEFVAIVIEEFKWPLNFFGTLPEQFGKAGLTEIVVERKPLKPSVVRPFYQYFVMFCGQMVQVFENIDRAKASKLSMLLHDIVKDAKEHGILPSPVPKVVVGRKRLIDHLS